MFSFFSNMIKSRDEWLNKTNTVANSATYLNTNRNSNSK